MTETNDCTELNYDTPSGIFQSNDGPTYWIIDSGDDNRYAVQLTSSEIIPQFGYIGLSEEVVTTGSWICDARLKVRKKRENSMPGICGLILHRGRRLYLKANDEHGRAAYLLIKGYDVPAETHERSHYPDWELVSSQEGEETDVFAAPTRLARLRSYGEQADLRHVEWC